MLSKIQQCMDHTQRTQLLKPSKIVEVNFKKIIITDYGF